MNLKHLQCRGGIGFTSVHCVNIHPSAGGYVQDWFAVLTKPRSESMGYENLKAQGFECLFPRVQKSVRGPFGCVSRIEPLFPRYLFLRADCAKQDLSTVRSTRGVSGLVRTGAAPAVVPNKVIAGLRDRSCPQTGLISLSVPKMTPGMMVKIAEGSMAGMTGIFTSQQSSDRVRLLINILNEYCSVDVPLRYLAAQV